MSIRRAALYARFSTELQSDRSVDDQIALCRNFAERGGFEVVRTYDDRAKSGASMIERDGLLRLLTDAKNNQFDVLIVEALDLCIKGVLSEDKLMERKKEIDPEIVRIKADLSMQPPPPKIDVHPATIAALRGDMEELGRILTKGPVEITEAVVQTLRSVVDSVVVYPTEPCTAPVVQVRGKLARLLGEDIENGFLPKAANKMVAEEGFEPPTQGL